MTAYICRNDRYAQGADRFESLEDFAAMCSAVFGEVPGLTERDGDYYEGDALVLEAVSANQPAFWGTDTETYQVVSEGVVWAVSHETDAHWVCDQVPGDAVPVTDTSVAEIEWPQEKGAS